MSRARRSLGAAAVVAALCSLLVSGSALATVVVPLTRASMVQRADYVVRATVVSQQSRWNADRSQILTVSRLRVTRWIKGSGGGELLVRQLGGAVGEVRSAVSGDASLRPGDDVVLFLTRGEGVTFLVALGQSAYHVERGGDGDLVVRRDLAGLTFAVPNGGGYALREPAPERPEKLDAFLADLARLAGGAR